MRRRFSIYVADRAGAGARAPLGSATCSRLQPPPRRHRPQRRRRCPRAAANPRRRQPAAPEAEPTAPVPARRAARRPRRRRRQSRPRRTRACRTPARSMVPSPAEMERSSAKSLPPAPQASDEWTAPAPVFTLHGYMRMRGELMDTFWLGRRGRLRRATETRTGRRPAGPDPFTRFRPLERRAERAPAAGRAAWTRTRNAGRDLRRQHAAVREHAPAPVAPAQPERGRARQDDASTSSTTSSPVSRRTSYLWNERLARCNSAMRRLREHDSCRRARTTTSATASRAPRLGRGPQPRTSASCASAACRSSWGLGMYYNAGDGIDDDYSTDLDRVLGITQASPGFYLSASYDFIAEGFFEPGADDRPLDAEPARRRRPVHVLGRAARHAARSWRRRSSAATWCSTRGVQFALRNQDSLYRDAAGMATARWMPGRAAAHDSKRPTYTTDLWAMLRYRGLRLEAEVAWVTGGDGQPRCDGQRQRLRHQPVRLRARDRAAAARRASSACTSTTASPAATPTSRACPRTRTSSNHDFGTRATTTRSAPSASTRATGWT